ncbi:MAG: YicC family protein [Ruminococcaceae bacterium]|nr:YicC family protein [Oscillospiraceae bacterium]
MAKSMTGYGHAQIETDSLFVSVEMKSVNHRYFELYPRVPRAYGFLEEKIKSYLLNRISRGKIECNVSIEALDLDDVVVRVNHSLAKAYLNALTELAETYELRNDISATSLTRYGEILSVHKDEIDTETIWEVVKGVLEQATNSFIEMRECEGEKLKEDIFSRIVSIEEMINSIEKRSPETIKEYNEKLKARIRELLEDVTVDEQRLLTEVAIFADKVAIDEELVRLRSHLEQLREMFEETTAVGRKMDFLVQEINREVNTIGSKATDLEINKIVVEIKAEAEKIREQVQNIE